MTPAERKIMEYLEHEGGGCMQMKIVSAMNPEMFSGYTYSRIQVLESRGFVSKEPRGRDRWIALTRAGRNMLQGL